MCFSAPKPPNPPKPPPMPNKQDDANQAAVQSSLKRAKTQNANMATQLSGALGDSGYGQNINRVTALGQTQ